MPIAIFLGRLGSSTDEVHMVFPVFVSENAVVTLDIGFADVQDGWDLSLPSASIFHFIFSSSRLSSTCHLYMLTTNVPHSNGSSSFNGILHRDMLNVLTGLSVDDEFVSFLHDPSTLGLGAEVYIWTWAK